MNLWKAVVVWALGAGLVCSAPRTVAGQEDKGQPEGPDAQKMMEAMAAMSKPGPHHEHLKVFAGKWKASVKHWMGPEGEPQTSVGTSEIEWVLGGRLLQEKVKGEFMGMPFEGLGYIGYDNAKKYYFGVWFDSMGTGMYTSTGTCDPSGKVFTLTMSYDDPMTGQPAKSKMVYKVVNENSLLFTSLRVQDDGSEQLEMEITYTRAG